MKCDFVRPRFLVPVLAAIGMIGAHPAAAQPAGGAISAEWFAGTWSDSADCSDTVRFQRDGRYVATGGEARWTIVGGNTLVLSNGTTRREIPIERVGDRQIRQVSDGVPSYRCPDGPLAAVDADWLVGTWSDHRDCTEPFLIERDGRFRAPNGVWGRWSLSGATMTLVFGENRQGVALVRVGPDEFKLAHTQVSSYRCG